MNKFKHNIFPIILLVILAVSSITLFMVTGTTTATDGSIVAQSPVESALQDASTLLLVISTILCLVYISNNKQHSRSTIQHVKNTYTPNKVMEEQFQHELDMHLDQMADVADR